VLMSACAASTAGGLTVGEEAGRALDETTDPARMPGASGTVEDACRSGTPFEVVCGLRPGTAKPNARTTAAAVITVTVPAMPTR